MKFPYSDAVIIMFVEDITSDKASKIIGTIDTLILPVGTIEAHGPHCSVAADVIVPVKMAQEIEKLAGDSVYIAPIIPYGHTWHLKDFPGSHDVSSEVLSEYSVPGPEGILRFLENQVCGNPERSRRQRRASRSSC